MRIYKHTAPWASDKTSLRLVVSSLSFVYHITTSLQLFTNCTIRQHDDYRETGIVRASSFLLFNMLMSCLDAPNGPVLSGVTDHGTPVG
jgi:hypothetical protein